MTKLNKKEKVKKVWVPAKPGKPLLYISKANEARVDEDRLFGYVQQGCVGMMRERWSNLDQDLKREYEKQAEDLKVDYKKEMEKFKIGKGAED